MRFENYTDFRLTLIDRLKRNDLDVEIRRFVLMAEEELNQKLRHPDMIKSEIVALVDGSGPLPADFLEIEEIYSETGRRIEGVPRRYGLDVNYDTCRYWVSGMTLRIGKVSANFNVEYYSKLPTLTTSASSTNWLLQRYPTLYYHATLKAAYEFIEDDDKEAKEMRKCDELRLQAKIDGDRKRFGDASVVPRSWNP